MLKIYNTLDRKAEEFKPLKKGLVLFYHCGPTVYWTQHIGNMRAVVLADLIRRSLDYLGFKVKYVRNYTDVGHLTSDEDTGEDKMEKGAKREGLSPDQIADKYINIFESDIVDLNVLPADGRPRATGYIKEMQAMVKVLLDKGFAYSTDLAIYFDITKAHDYTRLSGQDLSKNLADAGRGEISDPNKKHSADFVLWFFKAGVHQNAIQTWASPFSSPLVEKGTGFPGWHIECSAMSKKLLGDTLDIHMGGIEHIPVHHTNEIAQSEGANGVKYVNYWLHNEWLTVNGGKMAKSEGTAYSVAEIKEKGFDPLALRYFFLSSHYRSKQNFTWEALQGSLTALNNLRDRVIEYQAAKKGKIIKDFDEKFVRALEDDFNIPQALAVLWDLIRSESNPGDKLSTIIKFDKVLGLNLESVKKISTPPEITALAELRLAARREKDWARSDVLRQEIEQKGYTIEDGKDGYVLKKK